MFDTLISVKTFKISRLAMYKDSAVWAKLSTGLTIVSLDIPGSSDGRYSWNTGIDM
jgi:hypothetical protein